MKAIILILLISTILVFLPFALAQTGGPVISAFTANNFISLFERSFFVGERVQGPQLTVRGGSGFLVWKLVGNVPPGFTQSSGGNFNRSVLFSAEFRQAGTFSFSVQVTDDSGRSASLGPVTAVVGPYINSASGRSLRNAIAGWPYAASFILRDGNPTGDCAVAGTFPLTCTLSPSPDGTSVIAINGTPPSAGSADFLINVPTDAGLAGRRFFVTVAAAPVTALYFPLAPSTGPAGLAIVNPGTTAATVTFSAYDAAGSSYPSFPLTVSPGGQFSAVTSDLFPSAANSVGGMTGWIEVTSSSPGLQGFEVLGDFTARVAGIAGAGMSVDQVLPVSGGTAIGVGNPGLAPAVITIKAYDANGNQVGNAVERTVPAKGFYDSSMVDGILYGVGDSASVRHVRIRSSLGVAASALLLQTAQRMDAAAVAATDVASAPSELNFPHVISGATGGANYVTVVGITNPSAVTQTVAITFNNGTATALSLQASIPPAGSLQRTLQEMFSLPASFQGGWLQVRGTAALSGFVSYTDVVGGGSDIVPVQIAGSSSLLFSHIAALAPWSTGIALLNPGSADTTVEVYALNPSGSVIGGPSTLPTARFTLPARSKNARLLQELIPAAPARTWDGGFVFVRTTNSAPIFGIELFFLRGGVAIANVPAGVLPSTTSYTPPTTTPTAATTLKVELVGGTALSLGSAVTIVMSFTDSAGRVVPSVSGPISLSMTGQVISGQSDIFTPLNTTVTAIDGVARLRFLPPTVGRYSIRASYATVSLGTKDFDVSEAATLVIVDGDNQSGPMGQALPIPLRVRLTSPAGVPLPNRPIYFSPGNPSRIVSTDANGEAEFPYVVASFAGRQTVRATYYNILMSVNFTVTGTE